MLEAGHAHGSTSVLHGAEAVLPLSRLCPMALPVVRGKCMRACVRGVGGGVSGPVSVTALPTSPLVAGLTGVELG